MDSDALTTPRALTLNTAGLTIFNGLVGNTAPLLSLTTDNQGAAGEGTQFNLNLTAPGTLAGVSVINAVTINDPVTFNAAGSTLAVPTILTGVNGGAGSQTYASAATLARDTVLTNQGAGDITFGGTVNGPFNLFASSGGNEIFNGLVGNTAALTSLQTDLVGTPAGAVQFKMSLAPAGTMAGVQVTGIINVRDGAVFGAAHNGGTIPTVLSGGAQTYAQAASLTQDTILTSSGSGTILFGSTVDGAFALTLNTGGTTQFNGAVGGTAPLASLTTDSAGTTQLGAGSAIGITTTGSQTYDDPVVLGADASIASAGAVTFNSTVRGGFNLGVSVGTVAAFNDVVGGGNSPLLSLTTNGGSTRLNGGSVTTTASQIYGDAVLLGQGTTLHSTDATGLGNITFNSTVDGAFPLAVNTPATTSFNGTVGGVVPLASLSTDAGGRTVVAGGAVTTTGDQTYGDAFSYTAANTTLTSTSSGTLLFNSTLDGTGALMLDTAGTTQLNGVANVGSLATNMGGKTLLDGGSVNSLAGQTYGDAVVLGAPTILTDKGGADLTFKQTVDGVFTLALNTQGNNIFGGAVGAANALVSLTTDPGGSTRIDGGSVTTSAEQTYGDAVTLGADATLTSTGAGNLTFNRTVDGAFALTLGTGGSIVFNRAVGGTTPLGSVTTDAGGSTLINGGGVTTVNNGATTGAQTYNDAVRLGANTLLASLATGSATAGGNLTFNSTVDGAFALTLNTGALTIFNGVVGGTTPLSSLTTDNAGAAGEGTQFNMTVGGALAGVVVNGPAQINDAVLFNIQGASLAQPGVLTLGDHGQAYTGAVALGPNT